MGTNAIIVIQEPFEFRFPVSRGIKAGFLIPEFHNRFDDPFGFAVGFGITHPGEALLYSVFLTELFMNAWCFGSPLYSLPLSV
jgi:hypothetical protein